MIKPPSRSAHRLRIHKRIRAKLTGSTARPRLAIFRSLNHIYAQVIDDQLGKTVVSASTNERPLTLTRPYAGPIATVPSCSTK